MPQRQFEPPVDQLEANSHQSTTEFSAIKLHKHEAIAKAFV
jgi:hypothetical protein